MKRTSVIFGLIVVAAIVAAVCLFRPIFQQVDITPAKESPPASAGDPATKTPPNIASIVDLQNDPLLFRVCRSDLTVGRLEFQAPQFVCTDQES